MTKKKGNGAKDSSSNSIFYLSGKDVQEEARQEALRQEAVTPPAPTDDSNTLCSISGVVAGLSGAALGFVFGFGSKVISHRGAGRFKAARREGWGSAKSFALFGGVYTTASCMIQRLRMKQDPINGGLAGAITGLVLSWGGDPKQMILSVVMMGAFSYMVDRMNAPAAATSAISAAPATTGRRRSRREHDSSRQTWPLVQGPPKAVPTASILSPAIPAGLADFLTRPCATCQAAFPLNGVAQSLVQAGVCAVSRKSRGRLST